MLPASVTAAKKCLVAQYFKSSFRSLGVPVQINIETNRTHFPRVNDPARSPYYAPMCRNIGVLDTK